MALAIELHLVVEHRWDVVRQSQVRHHVPRRAGPARALGVEAHAADAAGRVAVVVARDQSARAEVHLESPDLRAQGAALPERLVEIEADVELRGLQCVDVVARDRAGGIAQVRAAVGELGADAHEAHVVFAGHDRAQRGELIVQLEARPGLAGQRLVAGAHRPGVLERRLRRDGTCEGSEQGRRHESGHGRTQGEGRHGARMLRINDPARGA